MAHNFQARPWTDDEDRVLLERAGSAPTPWEGFKAASAVLGRSLSACKNRYAKLRARGAAPETVSPMHRVLHRLARTKGRLSTEDIERVANETGLRYHSALSALAGLHARNALTGPCPECSDLKARDEEITRLSAEVTRLERLLREAEREAEALRERIAGLEAGLGVGLDPFAEKLAEKRELLALAGELDLKYDLERLGVHARPAPEVRAFAGRLALARRDLEWALARLTAGRPGALEDVRRYQALLNACVEGLVASIKKPKKEVV